MNEEVDEKVNKDEKISLNERVEYLIKRAAETLNSNDALKFSQAACNAANALHTLKSLESLNK